jgi:hypothetical protein
LIVSPSRPPLDHDHSRSLVHLAQQIRDGSIKLDFLAAEDGKAITAVGQSDEKLVQVLFALCEQQAQKAEVTPELFAVGLGGDVLEAASEALMQAVVLFTRPARRPVLLAVLERAKEAIAKGKEMLVQRINSGAVDQLMNGKLDQAAKAFDEHIRTATPSSLPTTAGRSAASNRGRSR